MKKIAILLLAIVLFELNVQTKAENNRIDYSKQNTPPNGEMVNAQRKARERDFEQKLKLTEAQKIKTRELRREGFLKMKPVMDEMNAKKQEAFVIKKYNLSNEEKEQKLIIIDKEINELHKKIIEIRKQNMKDFESILSNEQRKILKNMKKEGRENFAKEHGNPHKIDR